MPTNGNDSYVTQVDPWQTRRIEMNGANAVVMTSGPTQPAPQAPVTVPDPVPSPGWYPVQGAPELVRWWDGSVWGDVRDVDPPTTEVPAVPHRSR